MVFNLNSLLVTLFGKPRASFQERPFNLEVFMNLNILVNQFISFLPTERKPITYKQIEPSPRLIKVYSHITIKPTQNLIKDRFINDKNKLHDALKVILFCRGNVFNCFVTSCMNRAFLPSHVGMNRAFLPSHVRMNRAFLPSHVCMNRAFWPSHVRMNRAFLPSHWPDTGFRSSNPILLRFPLPTIPWNSNCGSKGE